MAMAVRETVLDIDFVGGAEGSGVAMADFELHCEVDLVRETDTVGDCVFVAIPVGSVLVVVAELHCEVDLVREMDTVGDRVFVAIPVGSVLVMVAELDRVLVGERVTVPERVLERTAEGVSRARAVGALAKA